jgi:hypothetical protein
MNARTARFFAVAAAVLTVTSLSAAGSEWLLRFGLDAEGTHRFAMSQTQSMDIDMGAKGRQQMENSSRMEFLQTVKELLSDGSFVLDTAFGRMQSTMSLGGMTMEFDTENTEEASHPVAIFQNFMKGKHFLVTMTPRGLVRSVDGLDAIFDDLSEALPDQPGMLQAMEAVKQGFGTETTTTLMQQAVVPYPEDAVAIGDTWHQDLKLPNPALGDLNISRDYTVEGAERMRERDCLRVGVASTIEFEGEGPEFAQFGKMMGAELSLDIGEATGQGTAWIDKASGLVVLSKSTQTIEMDMSFLKSGGDEAEGQDFDMHASITQHIEVELLE